MKRIILASASPRRQELLKIFDLKYECIPAYIDEEIRAGEKPVEAVRRIAEKKAAYVSSGLDEGIIIAADTIVVCSGEILGKPENEEDAFNKLNLLNGREHQVITAICLKNLENGLSETTHEITRVYFRNVSKAEIRAYIASGEANDKAGAYGIQGRGAVFIDKIEGCYFNVVGLPLKNLYIMLQKQGINLLEV